MNIRLADDEEMREYRRIREEAAREIKKENTMITIRNEQPTDYRKVEEVTRKAFWNLYVPGAYLPADGKASPSLPGRFCKGGGRTGRTGV